jgi:amidase
MIGDIELRTRDCLATIDTLDPAIGAWEHVDPQGALERAHQLDRVAIIGPLHGVPIGVKDIIDVAGMPTRCGTPIYATNVAHTDAACVAMARAAGAIIVGKTCTTELAAFHPAKTRNPHSLDHTPGGSSSGSAAAVAAGMVPLAFGTQTAGSVIRPAAFCGVVGFKPTFDLVPRGGVKMQSETLDTIGVLAQNLDFVMQWYAAMTGSHVSQNEATGTRPLRINIVTNLMAHADHEMWGAIADASRALSAAGAIVREVRLPEIFDEAQIDQRTIQLTEMARHYSIEHRQYRDQLSAKLIEMLDEGAAIDGETYMSAMARTTDARLQADSHFADCDAWLMPSAPGAAPKGLAATGDPIFSRLTTSLHLPAINLPVYRNQADLPLGLQLIGARGQDMKLLLTAQRTMDILRQALDD